MNSSKFNINYILELDEDDLKQEIQHLGMDNKNATDIIEIFQQILKCIDKYGHFPHTPLELMQYDGIFFIWVKQ